MAKKVIYNCENCSYETKDPNTIFHLDGKILNGEQEILSEDHSEKMLCSECLFNYIGIFNRNSQKENSRIEIQEEQVLQSQQVFKKISTIEEENELIRHLGFSSNESFKNVYDKSLLNLYYPIEDDEGQFDRASFGNQLDHKEVQLMFKVFAGIPQIKKIKIHVNDEYGIGFLDKEEYENIAENWD